MACLLSGVRDSGKLQKAISESRNTGEAQGVSFDCIGFGLRRESTYCAAEIAKGQYMCEERGYVCCRGRVVSMSNHPQSERRPGFLLGTATARRGSMNYYIRRLVPACRAVDRAALMHAAASLKVRNMENERHEIGERSGDVPTAPRGDLHSKLSMCKGPALPPGVSCCDPTHFWLDDRQ